MEEDYYPKHAPPLRPRYVNEQISLHTARARQYDGGQRNVLSIQETNAQTPSDTRADGIDMFPRMMDESLKLRLAADAMVETVIILLLPRIAARMVHPSWGALNAELKTYSITLIGPAEVANAYKYSLDPFYDTKMEEVERAQLNANRKRKRDEMLEGIKKKTAVHPVVQRNDDLFGFGGVVETAPRRDAPSSSHRVEADDDDRAAMTAWAGASEEDIQVFVDDRIRLIIYGTGDGAFQIKAFRFVLGVPIEV